MQYEFQDNFFTFFILMNSHGNEAKQSENLFDNFINEGEL
jgi:hypothetical protein